MLSGSVIWDNLRLLDAFGSDLLCDQSICTPTPSPCELTAFVTFDPFHAFHALWSTQVSTETDNVLMFALRRGNLKRRVWLCVVCLLRFSNASVSWLCGSQRQHSFCEALCIPRELCHLLGDARASDDPRCQESQLMWVLVCLKVRGDFVVVPHSKTSKVQTFRAHFLHSLSTIFGRLEGTSGIGIGVTARKLFEAIEAISKFCIFCRTRQVSLKTKRCSSHQRSRKCMRTCMDSWPRSWLWSSCCLRRAYPDIIKHDSV